MKTVFMIISVGWIAGRLPTWAFQIRSPSNCRHRLESIGTQIGAATPEKAAQDFSDTTTMTAAPAKASFAPFNFGPASNRDTILYTCHCPGYSGKGEQLPVAEQKIRISSWVDFMKQEQGITQVIALLDDNELILPNGEVSDDISPVNISDVYTNAQIPFLIQPMREVNAYRTIMECIDAVSNQGGKVVVHCTGGVGRAGRVASGWMVHRYGCTPAEAMNEVLEVAAKANMKREGTAEQLQAWINSCQPNVEGCCD